MTTSRARLAEQVWYSAARRFPWRVVRTSDYPVLYVNKWVRELVATLTRRPNWRGLALRVHEVDHLVRQLLRIRGLSEEGKTARWALAHTLRGLNTAGLAIVEDGPDRRYRDMIAVHETIHLDQFRNPIGGSKAKALFRHPAVSRTLPYLAELGHKHLSNAEEVVSEIAAYVGSGDHRTIGLSRKEASDWFAAYELVTRNNPVRDNFNPGNVTQVTKVSSDARSSLDLMGSNAHDHKENAYGYRERSQ